MLVDICFLIKIWKLHVNLQHPRRVFILVVFYVHGNQYQTETGEPINWTGFTKCGCNLHTFVAKISLCT